MIFITVSLTLYCALLLVLQIGWHRALRGRERHDAPYYPLISVIIPFRNEEENIAGLLEALKGQMYDNFEVIAVNDSSTDSSVGVATQNKFSNVAIINSTGAGKKAAIETGIAVAQGEIIVTTDADCIMNAHWLEGIAKVFANENVVFGFGGVGIRSSRNFFSRMQAVEFASLIGSGAATAALGYPTMCNGANLAFRKSTFAKVKGYEGNRHIASGDDEFLMRKVQNHFPDGIRFIPYKTSTVTTFAKPSLAEFFNQRLRWAAKWRHNKSVFTIALALFIFIVQLSILAAYASLFFSFSYVISLLLLVRLTFESSFIIRVCRFTGVRYSWLAFLALQIVYPFYVLVVGILANFVTPSWKSREI